MNVRTSLHRLGLLAFLSLLTFSALAQADQPSDDPAVAALRSRFKDARVPKLEDLLPGRTWACDYYSAEPGSQMHAYFGASYRFSPQADGTVLVVGDATTYSLTSSALVGSKNWGTLKFGEEHLRVGPQGELLVEFGLTKCSFEECLFHVVRDGCDDDWREALVGYSECRVTP